jgi:hypothetical protein
MKHRRKNCEVFAADQRHFNLAVPGNRAIQVPRRFNASEAAAQNNDPYHFALIRYSKLYPRAA